MLIHMRLDIDLHTNANYPSAWPQTGFFLYIKWRTWLLDWFIDWLINWLIVWLVDWLIDWLTDWLTDWLIDWVALWISCHSIIFIEFYGLLRILKISYDSRCIFEHLASWEHDFIDFYSSFSILRVKRITTHCFLYKTWHAFNSQTNIFIGPGDAAF